jgi:hypothetical protein
MVPQPQPEWIRLARELGAVDERGNLKFDRVRLEEIDLIAGRITLELITPFRAPTLTDDLQTMPPPFIFDRAADGHHVLSPVRRLRSALEILSNDPGLSPAERAMVADARNHGVFYDALVPLSKVTQIVGRTSSVGEEFDTEVVIPPAKFIFNLRGPDPPLDL